MAHRKRGISFGSMVGALMSTVAGIAWAQEAPDFRVLMLQSGQLYHADVWITEGGFEVDVGRGIRLRFPHRDVQFVGDSPHQAYVHRLVRTAPTDVSGHISLTHWCIRNGMVEPAEQQLTTLREMGVGRPIIERLSKEIDRIRANSAVTADRTDEAVGFEARPSQDIESAAPPPHEQPRNGPAPTNDHPPAAESPSDRAGQLMRAQLDALVGQLPDGVFHQFNVAVQPRLLNGCTTAGCHMSDRDSFRLMRWERGKSVPRVMTQRNLAQVLTHVDLYNVDDSRLLKYLGQPHGGMLDGVYERGSTHYQMIRSWLLSLGAAAPPGLVHRDYRVTPAKYDDTPETDNTPVPRHEQVPDSPSSLASPTRGLPAEPDSPTTYPSSTDYVPVDPFDPEVFNRRYFPPRR